MSIANDISVIFVAAFNTEVCQKDLLNWVEDYFIRYGDNKS